MPQAAGNVRIAITGKVLTAPQGSTAPVDVAAAWAVAWTDHGYTDPAGVSLAPKISKYDVKAWQADTPLRSRITERGIDVQFVLLQSGGLNSQLFYGGGSWALVGAIGQYTPPAPGVDDNRMLGVEFKDGAITKRFVFPSAIVTAVGKASLKASEEERYDVTFTCNGDNWFILSNDPADLPATIAA